mmetsp:Transcript_31061/g.67939  ORF Transcript_31061/g.67939 Transcript_31061/m.67939 type:complete len:220 (+) Transcript_31061:1019-1678(+)
MSLLPERSKRNGPTTSERNGRMCCKTPTSVMKQLQSSSALTPSKDQLTASKITGKSASLIFKSVRSSVLQGAWPSLAASRSSLICFCSSGERSGAGRFPDLKKATSESVTQPSRNPSQRNALSTSTSPNIRCQMATEVTPSRPTLPAQPNSAKTRPLQHASTDPKDLTPCASLASRNSVVPAGPSFPEWQVPRKTSKHQPLGQEKPSPERDVVACVRGS